MERRNTGVIRQSCECEGEEENAREREGSIKRLERHDLVVQELLKLIPGDRVLLEVKVEEGRVEGRRNGLIVGVVCEAPG